MTTLRKLPTSSPRTALATIKDMLLTTSGRVSGRRPMGGDAAAPPHPEV
jgi:hypothetical protein